MSNNEDKAAFFLLFFLAVIISLCVVSYNARMAFENIYGCVVEQEK